MIQKKAPEHKAFKAQDAAIENKTFEKTKKNTIG